MFGLKTKLFGGEPRAYRQEIGGTRGSHKTSRTAGLASGLVAGTLVATAMGWRPAEAIAQGDLVLTFDRGMQPVRAVTKGLHWDNETACPKALWPLTVPAGALGNQQPMTLLPEQCAMVESDTADILFGDPFSLVSASDLDGFRGIERSESTRLLDVIQLHFDGDEVVFANAGALLLCPSLRVINVAELLGARPDTTRYTPLHADEAKMLVEGLEDEDAVSVSSPHGEKGRMNYSDCA